MAEKAVRIEAPGPSADLVVKEMSIPECPPKGLVVKTLSTGICHSDVHLWHDKLLMQDGVTVPLTAVCPLVKWPLVFGHEICGEVHALGNEAPDGCQGLQVGDMVAVYPWVGCGQCPVCDAGRNNNCPKGGMATDLGTGVVDGGYQSYVAVADRKYVTKLPSDIPSEVACMFACSALTAFHACARTKASVENAAKSGGAKFLIIGAGGLGLWCIQIAKAIFPVNTKIFVADITEEKLSLAKDYGADETLLWPRDAENSALIEMTKTATGGVDASVDFVGLSVTVARAYEVANKGATMLVVGLAGGTFPLPLITLPLKDITIAGAYVGTPAMMQELIQLFIEKKLRAPPIMRVNPDGANDALHKLAAGQVTGRAVIDFK